MKRYVICTTPRSGSNHLCSLLESSGKMGHPSEFFNLQGTVHQLSEKHQLIEKGSTLKLNNYLSHIIDTHSTPNNTFGIKIFFNQLEKFISFPEIKELFQQSKFIFLTRKNIIAQAISMFIAEETNSWKSINEEKSLRETVKYNQGRISEILNNLIMQNIKWLNFFKINNLDYLEVTYESVLEDSNKVCQSISKYCGFHEALLIGNSKFQKQGDELNEEYLKKFIQNNKLYLKNKNDYPKITHDGLQII